VEGASTITGAMTLLENAPACLILDLMLPDGDGIQVLQHIRNRRLPTQVIVTTGASDAARLERVNSLSPMCILTKPIDLDRLQECLDSL
jgi:response regulator of citrate/malate metabolism